MHGRRAELQLHKAEAKTDSIKKFKQRVASVCQKYPGGGKLVGSLARRVELCLQKKAGIIGKRWVRQR